MGIFPDIIVTRSDEPIEQGIRDKIALFCNVKPDCVIENLTVPVLYQAPVMLEKSRFSEIVCRELNWTNLPEPDMTEWRQMLERIENLHRRVRIALVGKYVQLHDAYLSVAEALRHGGFASSARIEIDWIDSETLTPANAALRLGGADGILVPGGFGGRGIPAWCSPQSTRAKTASPIWASAWACRSRPSNLRATCWATPTRTPRSSPRIRATRSST